MEIVKAVHRGEQKRRLTHTLDLAPAPSGGLSGERTCSGSYAHLVYYITYE